MTAAANHAKLTEGPIHRHLVDMALPMMLGILSAVAFYAADTYFVGQLGTGPLAAISFTFPVVFLVINLSVGLGAGISSVLSRTIGAGDGAGSRRLASAALLFAVLFSAALSLLGMVTIEPLFTAMGAEPELLPDIRAYMAIWYPGLGFIILSMSAISILRSIGETRLPGYLMVLASLLNIVIDPILIFGWFGAPRLEIAGAAIATVASRGLLVAILIHFLWRRELLDWRWAGVGELMTCWRRILHVGLPASGTNVIIPLTMGVVVALVATFGSDAVAGFGVATRIEGVTLVLYYALSAVIGPVVGQNLGAGKLDRVRQAVTISVRFCFLSGVVTALILALVGGAVAGRRGHGLQRRFQRARTAGPCGCRLGAADVGAHPSACLPERAFLGAVRRFRRGVLGQYHRRDRRIRLASLGLPRYRGDGSALRTEESKNVLSAAKSELIALASRPT
jgi:putative MATE family efflux protein